MARRLDVVLVVDVESTCWRGAPPAGQEREIIEVGLCPVDVGRRERLGKHSLLIRPERSQVSPFCTELTTITADLLADAGSLRDACTQLKSDHDAKQRVWASWGDYDRRQFERGCAAAGIGYPFGPTHLNLKTLFALALGLRHEVGLDGALERLGLPLEGTHHRGDDDAWNIAGVFCVLLERLGRDD